MIKLILLLGEFYFQCFNVFFFLNCFLHVVIILDEYLFPPSLCHMKNSLQDDLVASVKVRMELSYTLTSVIY